VLVSRQPKLAGGGQCADERKPYRSESAGGFEVGSRSWNPTESRWPLRASFFEIDLKWRRLERHVKVKEQVWASKKEWLLPVADDDVSAAVWPWAQAD
jgi:hypothetical protein